MRRARAIVYATAVEMLSEPLVFLVTAAALALAVFAPVFHYHQFGDPTRMARDAGLSALILGGFVTSVFGAVSTWRRELESGTAMTALAHPVSRRMFFLAKTAGVFVAYSVFALTVSSVSYAVVNGCLLVSAGSGGAEVLARIYGPSLVLAVLAVVLPFAAAAFLNRFLRFRFTLTANLTALGCSLAAAVFRFDAALAGRLLPVLLLAALPAAVLAAFACAFASRHRLNVAAAATAAVAALMLPALGNYCMSDALSDGASLPPGYFPLAFAAALPALAGALVLGVLLFGKEDVG